jgi:hypothetical protein
MKYLKLISINNIYIFTLNNKKLLFKAKNNISINIKVPNKL